MQPLGNRILVREDADPDKIGSIIVPKLAKPQTPYFPFTGRIVAVGTRMKTDLKVGDRVAFERKMPMAVVDNLLLMLETEVAAVLE